MPGGAGPEVSLAVALPSRVGESPFWHPREQALFWCDIPGRRLNRFAPADGSLVHWDVDSDLASIAPMIDGGILMAMRDGLFRFDLHEGRRTRIAEPPYDPANERFNDGKCDPQGRFWVGTLYEPRDKPAAALYRLWDDDLQAMADGVTTANGLAWSPNGRTLYWTDTRAHTVYAFDFEPRSGELSARREFARFPPRADGQPLSAYGGRPDGAAVDTLGRYWVAMFEGQRLLCLSPTGEVVQEIALPVRCPTMPCFGGHDLKTLYLTTAREGRPAAELAEQPWAGCVLSLRVDVPGLPVNIYY